MPFKYILCRQKYTCRSCLALETHAIKLPGHSFFADVKARGRLELLNTIYTHSVTLLSNFMWAANLWLKCCGF